jgi:hypothetical protein
VFSLIEKAGLGRPLIFSAAVSLKKVYRAEPILRPTADSSPAKNAGFGMTK